MKLPRNYSLSWWGNFHSYDSKTRGWTFFVHFPEETGPGERYIVTGTSSQSRFPQELFEKRERLTQGPFLIRGYENSFKLFPRGIRDEKTRIKFKLLHAREYEGSPYEVEV